MQLDDYINKASHCENPMVVRNRYTGEDILVGCGHCAYCISRQSSINSIRIAKSASKWKYCYFVTLTYDNEHMPLISLTTQEMISGEIVYSDDGLRYSSDTEFKYMPLRAAVAQRPAFSSEYQTIFCKQVNGTIPFNRETKRKEPIEFTSTAVPVDLLRLVSKTTPETPFNVPDDMAVLPILNYYDCQNYIKRLRINLNRLGCNEKIHFYAAGEYGPVHFRPHFHLLLFGNTQKFSETVRQAHIKSWTFGRSDIQLTTGGASSYVASYISANSMLPVFYRQSKIMRPKSRASLRFDMEAQEPASSSDEEIARVASYISDGRSLIVNSKSISVNASRSYLNTVCPQFNGFRRADVNEISFLVRSVATASQRLRLFPRKRKLEQVGVSVLAISRSYLECISSKNSLTYEDYSILNQCRMISPNGFHIGGRILNPEIALGCIYRLFLTVSKFLRFWKLPDSPSFHEIKKIYTRCFAALDARELRLLQEKYSLVEAVSDEYADYNHYTLFLPKDIGLNLQDIYKDAYLERLLKNNNASKARRLVKHKRLNDANGTFANI